MSRLSSNKKLELLSPAANVDIAKEAILHGADAVYIGASSHGARKAVSNSIDSIAEAVDFAHQYRAKIYVTVNTLVYENEILKVKALIEDLYRVGVDALIVQDMGILRMNIPPIALHASTQCDIRTPEKAVFLEKAGFSQLVLARELSLTQISDIVSSVDIPVESFIHGALCVSYSGRCHASCHLTGRSANRGECAQICRLPFTLRDRDGRIISRDKHLLSLKDLNNSHHLEDLIKVGVSSFKIEGRLKPMDYVKNVTAKYNRLLDDFIKVHPDYQRCSYGSSIIKFTPDLSKSFNRGFTSYLEDDNLRGSIHTPKSLGEKIKDFSILNNGDGISFFDNNNNYKGFLVNKIEKNKIVSPLGTVLSAGTEIFRTNDLKWNKTINKATATRKLRIKIKMDETGVSANDEMGNFVKIPFGSKFEKSEKTIDYGKEFAKLGNTIFTLDYFENSQDPPLFIPLSKISSLRRELVESLAQSNLMTYPFEYRRREKKDFKYPFESLDYRDNVSNSLSFQFYKDHGVKQIEESMETSPGKKKDDLILMTSRYCILKQLGKCKKENGSKLKEPLTISSGNYNLELEFDCRNCEMKIKNSSPDVSKKRNKTSKSISQHRSR